MKALIFKTSVCFDITFIAFSIAKVALWCPETSDIYIKIMRLEGMGTRVYLLGRAQLRHQLLEGQIACRFGA